MAPQRKAFTIAIICFIILSSAFSLYAQNFSITCIKIKKDKTGAGEYNRTAEIVVNNCVKVRGIRVSNAGTHLRFKLPEYVSSRNRVYPQVKLLNREAELILKEALESGEPRGRPPAKNSFRIGNLRKFDSPSSRKAVAEIVFDENVEIECKIFDGENGLWVSWPSQQNPESGRWKKLVDITDYKLREAAERQLIDRYLSGTAVSDLRN